MLKQNLNQEDNSIFAFQTINVDSLLFNLFYDSGCGDLIISKESCDKLKSLDRANRLSPGPLVLHGVGNLESIVNMGSIVSGYLWVMVKRPQCVVCVDTITAPFPKYPLKRVEEDFHATIFRRNSGIISTLPKLPKEVGGTVDIMVGKQYLKYFPKEIVQLDLGLTLYKSHFKSPEGTDGVIAGPHPKFTKIDRISHFTLDRKFIYFSPSVQKYKEFCSLVDVPLLGCKRQLEQEFPVDIDGKCEFNSLCVVSGKGGMGLGNDNSCGIEVGDEVYTVRSPKHLKKLNILGQNIHIDVTIVVIVWNVKMVVL